MYKKVSKLFFQLLYMYPFIVLLFASGKIVGALMAAGTFALSDGTPAAGAAADIIKNGVLIFAYVLPLIGLPWALGQGGKLMGTINGKVTGLVGKASEGARFGFAAGVGNSRAAAWAQEPLDWSTKGNGLKSLAKLGVRGGVNAIDVGSGAYLTRRRNESSAEQKASSELYNARRAASARWLSSPQARAAAIQAQEKALSNDLSINKTLFDEDVLGANGVPPGSFLSSYAQYLNNRPGMTKPPAPSSITGATGDVNFDKLTPEQMWGAAALAAESGNVTALMAMRMNPELQKDRTFQTHLTRAITTNASKFNRASGGGFLKSPILTDEAGAIKATAAAFAAKGNSSGEAAANAANLEQIMKYNFVMDAMKMPPEELIALPKEHQQAIVDTLQEAKSARGPLYDLLDNNEALGGTPTRASGHLKRLADTWTGPKAVSIQARSPSYATSNAILDELRSGW